MSETYDVAVLGNGLAGLSLARLLHLEQPELKLVTLDRARAPRRKVGESTVEVGAHFLHERLGLKDLLARTQLPKNGLRYWFDDEERGLTFAEASEDGPPTYAYWQTYQLDRQRLEEDLLALNREAGIDHRVGVSGIEVEPGQGAELHRVRYQGPEGPVELHSRWLVDATGIRSLLGRQLDNLERDERLAGHSAAFAWFRGAKNVDELCGEHPRRKLCVSPRMLSTNHLMHRGYWIWLIPLADGALSVGLVADEQHQPLPRTRQALLEFLLEHRQLQELLGEAELLDMGVLRGFAYKARRYLHDNRLAFVGTSGGFVDPFYSNGLDFIALGCEAVVDALAREREGNLTPERLEAWNQNMHLFHDQALSYVQDAYPSFGSHELSAVRYRRDTHLYWNVWGWGYLSGDLRRDPVGHAERAAEALERSRFFNRLLVHVAGELEARGQLRRQNKGRYTFNHLGFRSVPVLRFERQLGHPPDPARAQAALDDMDATSLLGYLDALFEGDRSPTRSLLVDALRGPVLNGLRALEARQAFGPDYFAEVYRRLGAGLRAVLASEGVYLAALELTPDDHPHLLKRLLEACQSEDDQAAVRRRFHAQPMVEDFADLTPNRQAAQAPSPAWSGNPSPWLPADHHFSTIYELRPEWFGLPAPAPSPS